MCGVEKAGFCHDRQAMEEAVRLDTMLHAFMLFQSGIPVLYSGDEVGQVNDYTYKEKPEKAADSRYIHRGDFSGSWRNGSMNRKQSRIIFSIIWSNWRPYGPGSPYWMQSAPSVH